MWEGTETGGRSRDEMAVPRDWQFEDRDPKFRPRNLLALSIRQPCSEPSSLSFPSGTSKERSQIPIMKPSGVLRLFRSFCFAGQLVHICIEFLNRLLIARDGEGLIMDGCAVSGQNAYPHSRPTGAGLGWDRRKGKGMGWRKLLTCVERRNTIS